MTERAGSRVRVGIVTFPGSLDDADAARAVARAGGAPVMSELVPAAGAGLPVLGICNGFQLLCEAHLLPGALTRNAGLHFICRDQRLRIESSAAPWTLQYTQGQEILVPLKSGEGRYVAGEATLRDLTASGRIVASYV